MGTGKITGGCACGAIKYSYDGEPIADANCHCRDCQRSSGSAYSAYRICSKDRFEFEGLEPKLHSKTSDAGNEVSRGFCPECGSPLTFQSDAWPTVILVTASSLDRPETYKPAMDVFVSSAQHWDVMNESLAKFERAPVHSEASGR